MTEHFRREPQLSPREAAELAKELDRADDFFESGSFSIDDLEDRFPLGPEAAPESEKAEAKKVAMGILERIRNSPITKPIFLMLGIMMASEMLSPPDSSDAIDETQIEQALEDPVVEQEFKKLVFEELRESGDVMGEVEGRYGLHEWENDELIEYENITELSGRFQYLHKDNPEILHAYQDPLGRVESFKALYNLMGNEFSHSRLAFDFAEQSVEDAVSVLPTLEPQESLMVFTEYSDSLMSVAGVKAVQELATGLMQSLPAEHPVTKKIQSMNILSETVTSWLEPSSENSTVFNQVLGRIETYHKQGDKMILLDAFPGNGGPPNGAAWEKGMPAHIAVRTPDGDFDFDRMFEKKSGSWQSSWVTDTAELRWTKDQNNVEYKDQDGRWKVLTGEDAEFTLFGAPEKPFREKTKSNLYRGTSEKLEDGSWKRPRPFEIADALGPDGELRPTWDKNDFGPKSIRMKNGKDIMSIYFHSSPTDEAPNAFLDYSHGCIHMKPADLEAMGNYMKRGSDIRISSFGDAAKNTTDA